MRLNPSAFFACCLAVLVGLAWLAYRPGLNGPFLFDDFINLPNLGAFGPVDNATTFLRYLTSGTADPTGRPLALLSFLIDARDWPADPAPFKRTSVLLHLLNGVLLAALLLKLGRALGKPANQTIFAAVLGTAFWLLHPLFVSTTLYVVQREAMLPTTFILLGLIGYCRGREIALGGQLVGVFLAAFSIGTCTVLAVLSKANGALLPLLAWILDAVILAPGRPIDDPRTHRSFAGMRRLVLITPSLLLFAYLVRTGYEGFAHGMPAVRPWTLSERLLTEARILVDYLMLLWLPRPYTTGLFNDAFNVSAGLISPPSTLLCVLVIAGLATWAWKQRHGHPAVAAAILFFFAGHLLESTVIPLELYFEHRNYNPALLMFWPLALWFSGGGAPDPAPHRWAWSMRARAMLAALLVLSLTGLTSLGADLWGNVDDQALVWAYKNPQSARAQAYAAQVELARGQTVPAITRLQAALTRNPDEIQLSLNLVGAKCQAQSLTPVDIEQAAAALRTAPNTGRLGYDWFERALAMAQAGSCPQLTLEVLDQLLEAAAHNPRTQNVPGRLQDRLHLQGRIALLRGEAERARTLFNAALDADPQPGAALQQAAILASAGHPEFAEQHLDHLSSVWKEPTSPGWSMASIHAWLLWRQGYWANEIAHLRKLLDEDIAASNGATMAKPATEQSR